MKSAFTVSAKSILAVVIGVSMASCGLSTADSSDEGGDELGSASQAAEEGIRLSMIEESQEDDVVGFSIIVKQNGSLVDSACVLLEEETLPAGMLPEGSGDDHRFADRFFALAASDKPYHVKARPVRSCDPPKQSKDCDAAEDTVLVEEGKTTEVVLISHCDMPDTGGLDVVATLQHDPVILDLVYSPSKFILTCEELTVTVMADDQDGDDLFYEWEVTGEPGALFETADTDTAAMSFLPKTAGDYGGSVEVCDNFDDCTGLSFPIHVQLSADLNENSIGDECEDADPEPDAGPGAGPDAGPND